MEPADLIWMNGEFVAWEDAKVHVLTHGLHYGTGVFEGIRCYDTETGPGGLPPPGPPRPAVQSRPSSTTCRSRSTASSCARRRSSSSAATACASATSARSSSAATARWACSRSTRRSTSRSPCGSGAPTSARRASATASARRSRSWRRISPDSLIPHAKASGQYLNSVLAKIESHKAGYEEAILLDDHGYVCEGSGENIFVVRDGVIVTPPQTASILDGINRKAVMQIARDLGFEVVERDIARAELYLADEVFFTGTAAELVPVREVDDHAVGTGRPGEITRAVQQAFEDALHGRTERYREWLDPCRARAVAAPRRDT